MDERFGSYIRQSLSERGYDISDAALHSRMSPQNFSAVLKGHRDLTVVQSVCLDQMLGLEPGTLIKMQDSFKVMDCVSGKKDVLPSCQKRKILEKIKSNGGFWSYDGIPECLDDECIIEEGLRHLDFEDMHLLFELWSYAHVKRVWRKRLVPEGKRSNIMNMLLGVMFFNVKDIEGYLKKYGHC